MNKAVLVALAILTLVGASAPAADGQTNADAIVGIWHTPNDETTIRIFKSDRKYFGQIVKLKVPNFPADFPPELAGKPKFDGKNPDPNLRERPIIGLELMKDFVYERKNHWTDGKIYDPESGRTYSCKLTLDADGSLEVRGYVGISLFRRTTVWTAGAKL